MLTPEQTNRRKFVSQKDWIYFGSSDVGQPERFPSMVTLFDASMKYFGRKARFHSLSHLEFVSFHETDKF